MRNEKRTVQVFMVCWLLLFLVGCWFAATGDKLALHSAMNGYHTPALDRFFAAFTHVADGLVPTALAFIMLFWKGWRAFLLVGLSALVSALFAQFLKHGPYSHLDRPSMFREQLVGMPWVEGIDLHAHNSFPSGHTTAAFAMCMALAIIVGKPRFAMAFAILAGLLGYARIYLSQHFLQDTVTGAALGTLTCWAVYHALYVSRWSQAPWLKNRPFAKA
ncbi:MAG: phosphatase PAP2 family protein [Flavobacteriales bacterium]